MGSEMCIRDRPCPIHKMVYDKMVYDKMVYDKMVHDKMVHGNHKMHQIMY